MSGKKRDGTLLAFLVRDCKKTKPNDEDNVVPVSHAYDDESGKVEADLVFPTSISATTSFNQGAQPERVSIQKYNYCDV